MYKAQQKISMDYKRFVYRLNWLFLCVGVLENISLKSCKNDLNYALI